MDDGISELVVRLRFIFSLDYPKSADAPHFEIASDSIVPILFQQKLVKVWPFTPLYFNTS